MFAFTFTFTFTFTAVEATVVKGSQSVVKASQAASAACGVHVLSICDDHVLAGAVRRRVGAKQTGEAAACAHARGPGDDYDDSLCMRATCLARVSSRRGRVLAHDDGRCRRTERCVCAYPG